MKYKVGDKFVFTIGSIERWPYTYKIAGTDINIHEMTLKQLNRIVGEGDFDIDDKFEIVISEILPDDKVARYRLKDTGIWLREDILDNLTKIEEIPKYVCKIDLDDTESTSIDWEIIKQFIKLSSDEIYKIFGTWYMSSVVDVYTYEEIANKMTEYMKPKVKVGDIVERTAYGTIRNWLCIHISNEEYTFIDNEGNIIRLEYVDLLPVVGHCEDLVNILSKLK